MAQAKRKMAQTIKKISADGDEIMKSRSGFVSNSSSTSFIIRNGDIGRVAKSMLDTIVEEWKGDNDWMSTKEVRLFRKNLEKALRQKNVIEGKIRITMPSCNYETYIFKVNNDIYVSTCNNHQWDPDSMGLVAFRGDGSDGGEEDNVHRLIGDREYFNIRNCLIHSKYKWDMERQIMGGIICPNCGNDFGGYVVWHNKNLCEKCFKGVLGTKEIIEWVSEKEAKILEAKERKDQKALEKRKRNVNSIFYLEP